MADSALAIVAEDQKRWSLTANALKRSIGRWRLIALGLAISGAALETLAAQIHRTLPDAATAAGYAGAVALALVGVVQQRKLRRDRVHAWIVARAASEALKREMYLFRASAGPYSSGTAADTLLDRRRDILATVTVAQQHVVHPIPSVTAPGTLDPATYLNERVRGQIDWFRARAEDAAERQRLFDGLEFGLAVLGAGLGAALTLTGQQGYGAWVAVVTTVIAAIAADVQGERYAQLTVTYRATADRLAEVEARWSAKKGSLAELVERCEAVLLEENQGWIAGASELLEKARASPSQVAPSPSRS